MEFILIQIKRTEFSQSTWEKERKKRRKKIKNQKKEDKRRNKVRHTILSKNWNFLEFIQENRVERIKWKERRERKKKGHTF